MTEQQVEVTVASGIVVMKVGRKNIAKGWMIGLTKQGNLAPLDPQKQSPVGAAYTPLKARTFVHMNPATGECWDPDYPMGASK